MRDTYVAEMKSSKQLTCTPIASEKLDCESETTYLMFPGSPQMPLLAKLSASADVRHGEDSPICPQEGEDRGAEEGADRNCKASVACKPYGEHEVSCTRAELRSGPSQTLTYHIG